MQIIRYQNQQQHQHPNKTSSKYSSKSQQIHTNIDNFDNYAVNGGPSVWILLCIFIKFCSHKIINKFNNFQKSDNYARNEGPFYRFLRQISTQFANNGGRHPLRVPLGVILIKSSILHQISSFLTIIAVMEGFFRPNFMHFCK